MTEPLLRHPGLLFAKKRVHSYNLLFFVMAQIIAAPA
jgi:hypothetical protein